MCLQLQITYNVLYMTKSGSKYIKAWLCLLYDAFELRWAYTNLDQTQQTHSLNFSSNPL